LKRDSEALTRPLQTWAAILLGLLFVWALPADAAPVCFGGEDGCTPNRIAHYPGGVCVVWYQPKDDWEPVGYCVKYADLAPDEKGSFIDVWLGDPLLRSVLWPSQVTRDLTDVERETFASLLEPVPPSLYVVKPYFTGSRPTYPIVNGARSTKSNGRIATGEPCSGPAYDGSYRQVGTNMVAVCSRR
jgi:hypothetical protein